MTVEEMDLEPDVAAKARELQHRVPGVIFTSGRRGIEDQARAMAQNTVLRRDYIRRTYASSAATRALQAWVDATPTADTVLEIAAGLERVMRGLRPAALRGISRHLIGRAFDVRPHSCLVGDIRALHPQKFLTQEGGLERWHAQF